MSYQVIARKYRPQHFQDVLGQRGVTETLRNALASGRLAHAFVFAGARGVGKTTTARILARALNCVQGPTPEPCGDCDPCREIAAGRDIDVLEIDAATHTQVDKVRDIIIEGLAIRPVRDRYKIFIIDEVHQLSASSFNALLKSLEEPPPHVVFMMATTELHKIPETITSRSQVYEFKTISLGEIAGQLRRIAAEEGIEVDEAALALLARAAEGSMRDAQSALDQVIAFAGARVSADDVRTVLGLIGRDVLVEIGETVANEDAPSAFALAARIVESGQDLRLVTRELTRLVRDLMVISVDPARVDDPDIAADSDPSRLAALAARFSREDLLRAFDVLGKVEQDIRFASQPRYHLEMALLKWIHTRKLTPLSELMAALGRGDARPAGDAAPPRTGGGERRVTAADLRADTARPAPAGQGPGAAPPSGAASSANRTGLPPAAPSAVRPATAPAAPTPATSAAVPRVELADPGFRDAFLNEIKKAKRFFHGAVVAQARRIDVGPEGVVFVFARAHQALRNQFEQNRGWLESLVTEMTGRSVSVTSSEDATVAAPAAAEGAPAGDAAGRSDDLKKRAMDDQAVQILLDVFPAEITKVEEIEG